MATPPVPPLVAVSVVIYRRLLWAYPPAFQRAYGPQMVHIFREQCRVAVRQRGAMGLVVVWVRTLLDGRYNASIEDVQALAHPVLRHRILLNFEGQADGLTADAIVGRLLDSIRV